jgi:hypothetical protein
MEGPDVPLIAVTADAARTMVARILRECFNSQVLIISLYPPQVVFCNAEISRLADLERLMVHASGSMTSEQLDALIAEGVNLFFFELRSAAKSSGQLRCHKCSSADLRSLRDGGCHFASVLYVP